MREAFKSYLDDLKNRGGDCAERVKRYRDIEQRLAANPEDAATVVQKLFFLADAFGWKAFDYESLDAQAEPCDRSNLLIACRERLRDASEYVKNGGRGFERSAKDAATTLAMKESLLGDILEEARLEFTRLANCLPLTAIDIANMFRITGLVTHDTAAVILPRKSAQDASPVINLDEWSHGEFPLYDLCCWNDRMRLIDQLQWVSIVLDRMMDVERSLALLFRVSALERLLPRNAKNEGYDILAPSDALHLSSNDELLQALNEWPEFQQVKYRYSRFKPAIPSNIVSLLQRWVLGDCLEILNNNDATVAAICNASFMLGYSLRGLVGRELVRAVECLASIKKLEFEARADWHMAVACLDLMDISRAESHLAAALDRAMDDDARRNVVTRLRVLARVAKDEAKSTELSQRAESILYPEVCRAQRAMSAIMSELSREWAARGFVSANLLDLSDKQQLVLAAPYIERIIALLNTVVANPSLSEVVCLTDEHGDGNGHAGIIHTVIAIYLRLGGDDRAKRLAEVVVSCHLETHELRRLALLAAAKLEDLNAFRTIWDASSIANNKEDLFSIVSDLTPGWALRGCEMLAGSPHSPAITEALAEAAEAMLHGTAIAEEMSEAACARIALIREAFEGMSAILLRPVALPRWCDNAYRAMLKNSEALPLIGKMKEQLKGEFSAWIKLYGMRLILADSTASEGAARLGSLIAEFEKDLYSKVLDRLKKDAAEAERKKAEAEISARNQVIQDLSHSVKNLVASIVDPLDELAAELPEQRVVLGKALRGARLIREIINAVNLSSRGSLTDFAKDAEEALAGGGTSLAEIVRMSLEAACDNMFDTKFLVSFSRNYFPDKDTYQAAHKEWRSVRKEDFAGMVEGLAHLMFKISLDLGRFADIRISDTKGSCTKLLILFQELLLNAVKYTSFVEKSQRAVSISLSSAQPGFLLLIVRNTHKPGTSAHTTRLGQEIVHNLAKLLQGQLDIGEEGDMYAVTLTFPDFFDGNVRKQIAAESAKEVQHEGTVC